MVKHERGKLEKYVKGVTGKTQASPRLMSQTFKPQGLDYAEDVYLANAHAQTHSQAGGMKGAARRGQRQFEAPSLLRGPGPLHTRDLRTSSLPQINEQTLEDFNRNPNNTKSGALSDGGSERDQLQGARHSARQHNDYQIGARPTAGQSPSQAPTNGTKVSQASSILSKMQGRVAGFSHQRGNTSQAAASP